MERLKKQDAEAGIESRPITDAQKAQIAEIRNFYEAKIAEAQVLHESNRRNAADLASLEADRTGVTRRDRERLASERDRKGRKGPFRVKIVVLALAAAIVIARAASTGEKTRAARGRGSGTDASQGAHRNVRFHTARQLAEHFESTDRNSATSAARSISFARRSCGMLP